MAGYVIHLAVAERYIKKHVQDIKNYEEFIEGVIYPDSVLDKALTHHGEKSSKVNLKSFLKQNEINSDYNKGYFLHLVTDYIFYNKLLECFSKDIYNDYDILNKTLEEKFEVKIPKKIRENIFYNKGELKILELNSVVKFIEEVSNYNLEQIQQEVLKNNNYWLEFRNLRRI